MLDACSVTHDISTTVGGGMVRTSGQRRLARHGEQSGESFWAKADNVTAGFLREFRVPRVPGTSSGYTIYNF
jgi:hypothetical protein